MENEITLRQCFDAQRFHSNAKLAALIADTLERFDMSEPIELEDESLDVWAAGGIPPIMKKRTAETEDDR